jgi:hypothetical protein
MTAKKTQPDKQRILDDAAAQAVKIISDASAVTVAKIAAAAQEAHQVVTDAAATSVRVLHLKSADDHDLLIELKTRMEGIKTDIKDLKDGTTKRIDDLETGKCNKADYSLLKAELDQLSTEIHVSREKRMRSLETKMSTFWITVSLYSIFIAALAAIMVAHIFKTS